MRTWSLLLSVLLALVLLLPAHPQAVVAAMEPTLSIVPDKTVTLTFDDGPDPRYTPAILDMLKKRHLQATFFIVGRNAIEHPDLVRRIERDGHTIANHTLTHPHLEQLTLTQVNAELQGGDAALTSVLGPTFPIPHFFRPPRGNVSQAILETTENMHKQLILWNVCVENHSTTTPDQVEARVMDLIRERHGGILLAHDGELDRSLTVQSLPRILDDLQREGYHIVTLQEYLDRQTTKEAR
ncbi:polysaccharide deacetylase family protein [Tumebacillus permanentifrigoris]|uniref:Peptidoglycan/xylan/chitin deacetylase (PgdA/CDA1 family) n=1 Tax=Tumebacillus permanentifrigoris TaxID=378543 RepID=A0A316D836_9BACL|nr:polysaccharide deacetylase family protein [Tumebacillus permanentifrigoris]PWK12737.1 peptidoglycan/xylan/chitin deacetylase (PgdA/CDA1 family) [Tumebacillus permanentifrigoris]